MGSQGGNSRKETRKHWDETIQHINVPFDLQTSVSYDTNDDSNMVVEDPSFNAPPAGTRKRSRYDW
eukprot:5499475-Pleurochrysis_carterae.AAC.1